MPMKKLLQGLSRIKLPLAILETLLGLRATLFIGTKYVCPCCGWGLRAFTSGGISLKERELSYCPRCNSKARHRRIWLFLEEHTNLFTDSLRLFEVAPKFSFARRFHRMPNISYITGGLQRHPENLIRMDLTAMPIAFNSLDALICVHVLEEITQDSLAMDEMFRILKPGGWAVVTVPTNMDAKTYENPLIISPQERKREFGEPAHVRVYGYDLAERLRASGFIVTVDLAKNVSLEKRARYGLRTDENIFLCKKPVNQ
jgi:SAM-dependent methyltransferase